MSSVKKKKVQPREIAAEMRLLISHHPDIHPDDAQAAVIARVKQKVKDRNAHTAADIEEIGEDLFLASLANTPPEKWTGDTWHTIQARTKGSKVGQFHERMTAATVGKRRRVSEFDEVDLFLLKNWRVLRSSNPKFKRLPGLQDWHPRAVVALLKHVLKHWISEKGYQDKRHSNGLTPVKTYYVLDAGTHLTSSGQWAVKTKD